MADTYQVRMWGLTREQRDHLLACSRAWDSYFEDGEVDPEPHDSETTP